METVTAKRPTHAAGLYARVRDFGRSLIYALPGTICVGVITAFCFAFHADLVVVGFLYLIAVVLQALIGDFVSSMVVSVIADLCLNYFFVPPILSFQISDSSDAWALASFLITSLVITRLTTRVRRGREVTELQRRQMKLLYDLAQRLLGLNPSERMLARSLVAIREVFNLRSICLYDGTEAELYTDGDPDSDLEARTRMAYISHAGSAGISEEVATATLRASGRVIGAIGYGALQYAEFTAGPLTELAAAVLERSRVFRETSQASAAAQAEAFRGAILDALAHEFKTPLATIITAAGGLKETGGLRPEQLELAEMAEAEATRLAMLTSRLLRVAQLDREEIKPHLEPIDVDALLGDLAAQCAARWTDRTISLAMNVTRVEVLADPELLQLAVRQLLENAYKYSQAASTIKIDLDTVNDFVVIRVSNAGQPIAASERRRIFERYYRGDGVRKAVPGSGLGLYIARKIVQAHGGELELETGGSTRAGATFRLTIPLQKASSEAGETPHAKGV